MKNIKILLSVIVLGTMTSCSEFLSEVPDNRTELDSSEKIAELLVNAYPKAVPNFFVEAMSDNFGDSKRLDLNARDASTYYKFEDFDEADFDSPTFFWRAGYDAIAHANQALEAIEKLGNPKELDGLRGEALLARAYSHFILVNTFSVAYDPATAGSELGVPVVTEVEKTLIVDYKRASIEEVYNSVEADLLAGIELVVDRSSQKSYHFTKAAANAFAAKFFLYKGEWDKVLEYSNFLGDKPVKKLRDNSNYMNLDYQSAQKLYTSQSETANLLLSAGNSILFYNTALYRYGITKDLARELFDGSNYNVFGKRWAFKTQSFYECTAVLKYYDYFIFEGSNTSSGQPYASYVLLDTDDVYLNRIEAVIMSGDLDRAAMMMGYISKFKSRDVNDEEYNTITKSRVLQLGTKGYKYEPFYALSQEQASFIDVLAEIRRRQGAAEGTRWFDIKRYNMEVEHLEGVSNQVYKLERKDLRKAVQLPSYVKQYGVELNPR